MKHFNFVLSVMVLLVMASLPCWSANIGFIAPRDAFLGEEDPVNDEFDKEFVIETMEMNDPGLSWVILHMENELGHTVNIYNAGNDVPEEVIAANDMVFISENISSSQVGGDYTNSSIPVLITEVFIIDDMGITSDTTGFTGRAHGTEIEILDTEHPITQGLPERFIPTIDDPNTGEPAIAIFGTWSATINTGQLLARMPSVDVEDSGSVEPRTNVPILHAFETGTVGNDARWLLFSISDEVPVEDIGGNPELRTLSMLNDLGIQLLNQSLAWLLDEDTTVNNWSVY